MSHIKIVTPGTAETIKLGSTTVRVLEDGRLTDNRIGAIVCTVPAQTKPLPQHLHRMHGETFLVIQGTIRFAVNEEEQT